MSETNSTLVIVAALVSLIPGAYFAWMVLKGVILSLRRNRDDEL
jgi:hypothetical protein